MDRVRQLLSACEHGEAPVVQTLLDEGTDVDCEDDEAEITPLQVWWKWTYDKVPISFCLYVIWQELIINVWQ